MKKRLPKSLRKYLRRQKARLRRGVLDVSQQNKKIKELYEQISKKYQIKQSSSQQPKTAKGQES